MNLYAYLLLPAHTLPTEALRRDEAAVMAAHFRHLETLLEGRTLQLSGVGGQADFGLVVFKASSQAAAERTMINDPLVAEGLMTGMCVPFQFVLRGDGVGAAVATHEMAQVMAA